MIFFREKPSFLIRTLARACDYFFVYLLGCLFLEFSPYFFSELAFGILALATPIISALLEPFFLHYLGTTPCKYLFGIQVRDAWGQKPSWTTAFRQAFFLRKRREKDLIVKQTSSKRRFLGFAIIAVLALTVIGKKFIYPIYHPAKGAVAVENWVPFSNPEFAASFPLQPQELAVKEFADSSTKLELHEWQATIDEKTAYTVSYMEMPSAWKMAGSRTLLKGAIKAVTEYFPGAILVDKEFADHQNHSALDFRLFQGEKELKGRLIISKGKIYNVMASYKAEEASSVPVQDFIDSLSL